MRGDDRIVLLSWPRTGSSSLWRILGAHPSLELMPDEPFNEHFAAWAPGNEDYLDRISGSARAYEEVLDSLFRAYRGIKVLDYQLDDGQLAALLTRQNVRIIYLSRRNLLQTAVSDRIAKQVDVWNRWDLPAGEVIAERYRSLQPLDLDDLRAYIVDLQAHLRRIDALLHSCPDGAAVRICYEDLFLAPPSEQRVVLDQVWAFLDLEPVDGPSVDRYLDQRRSRLASFETYGRLPNAAEVNEALGCDETGYLPAFML